MTHVPPEVANLIIAPEEFTVPTDPVPYATFSALVQDHREFADSFIKSIELMTEHQDATHLVADLFLPRQPSPYFIQFHLPPFTSFKLAPDPEDAGCASTNLLDCTVSFIPHRATPISTRPGTNQLKFTVQPTLLFLDRTMVLLSQELWSDAMSVPRDMFYRVVMQVLHEITSKYTTNNTTVAIELLSKRIIAGLSNGI